MRVGGMSSAAIEPDVSNVSTIVGAPLPAVAWNRCGRANPTSRNVSPMRKSTAGTWRSPRRGRRTTFGCIALRDQAVERRARRRSSHR